MREQGRPLARSSPDAPVTVSRDWTLIGAALSGLLILVGCLGPWVTSGTASISGQSLKDGKITAAAALVMTAVVLMRLAGKSFRGAGVITLFAAIRCAGSGINDTATVHRVAQHAQIGSQPLVEAGWGVQLVGFAGVAALLLLIASAIRERRHGR